MTKAFFFHNTKVSTSKINEDKLKETKREINHVKGRAIGQDEMVCVILDLNFVAISTISLELRAGVDKGSLASTIEDAADTSIIFDIVRQSIIHNTNSWRQQTDSEKNIIGSSQNE